VAVKRPACARTGPERGDVLGDNFGLPMREDAGLGSGLPITSGTVVTSPMA
jgi:hypothetical protein